jgi:Ricin-type beta-trefoil lectin domain-like
MKTQGAMMHKISQRSLTNNQLSTSQLLYQTSRSLALILTTVVMASCNTAPQSNAAPSLEPAQNPSESLTLQAVTGVPTDGYYRIRNNDNKLCLEAKDADAILTSGYGPIVQTPCLETMMRNQLWRIESVGLGGNNEPLFKITLQNPGSTKNQAIGATPTRGQALSMTNAGAYDATNNSLAKAIQLAYSRNKDQQWYIRQVGSSKFFNLVNFNSGRRMTVPNCNLASGVQLAEESKVLPAPERKACGEFESSTNRASTGEWGSVIGTNHIPIAAANLPDGKVLMWATYKPDTWTYKDSEDAAYSTKTVTSIFDPKTQTASANFTVPGHDFFCPGLAQLKDGRIMMNGGRTFTATMIYNPSTNAWNPSGSMNIGRGYNASVALSNGNVFTLGGSWSGFWVPKDGELWNYTGDVNSQTPWTNLGGAKSLPAELKYADLNDSDDINQDGKVLGIDPLTGELTHYYRRDNHMWLFAASNGRVFQAGPSKQMNWYNTSGAGSSTPAGDRANSKNSINGNAVMYDTNKILTLGGNTNYDGKWNST